MSGGRFQYTQFAFASIADDIREIIETNACEELDDWGCMIGRHYSDDTLARFEETAKAVERAAKMVTRVDWLLSGDDGEESFHRRWDKEIGEGHE